MKIFFLQFFCVFLPPFLRSFASVRSLPFLSFIEPIFAWNVPLASLIFLKRSVVFPILLFSSLSLHWSLRKAFLSLLVILWNSAFKWVYLSFSPLLFASLLFTAICKVVTGLEKVSFHSNSKERQCQRMLKLPHNCTHPTHWSSNAQNSPSQASAICEPWNSRCSSWFYKRQRNQRSNCQHPLDHGKSKRVPEKHLFLLYWLFQSLWLCGSQ